MGYALLILGCENVKLKGDWWKCIMILLDSSFKQ